MAISITRSATTTPTRAPSVDPPRPTLTHRADIDGLRALAIVLVVGYHAHVPGFDAGFIGVDVFFVLSGYLITRLIAQESDRTGTVHLGRFWLRRFRRLFAAAATMIISVLLATMALETPLEWPDRLLGAVAALTYWSNHLFAGEAGSYFSPSVETNPFLHTWSLAVEEQFYVLWPMLFFLIGRFVDPRETSGRRVRLGVTAGFVASSLALSMRLTDAGDTLAFYSAISRAWEFGAGALLAMIGTRRIASGPATARVATTAAGLALLGLALIVIDDATPYPGTAALLAVGATLALLAAEPSDPVVGAALRSRPARTIGLVSYSWYLWHWPVIVMGVAHLGTDSTTVRVLLAGASLVPAVATYRLIEDPIRRSSRLARSPRATIAVVTAFALAAAAAAGAVWLRTDRAHGDPLIDALAGARDDFTTVDGACSVLDAEVLTAHCVGGVADAERTVMVVGDSHGAHWLPAVDAAAMQLRWRRIGALRVDCPSIRFEWPGAGAGCAAHQRALPDVIAEIDPDLVVMSHSVGYLGGDHDDAGEPVAISGDSTGWRSALADFATGLADDGIDLLVVLDVPRFADDPLECAARAGEASSCALHRGTADRLLVPFHELERSALELAGHGGAVDPRAWLCDETTCPLVIDGMVAYADAHHLTGTFADSLGSVMAAEIERVDAG